MVGLDCDNGAEFINHALVAWCAERAIFMTRARAHTCTDNAHVEQKNGDIVRKSAFRYRYDTPEELTLLNELWGYVNLRKNFFLHKEGERVVDHEGRTQHPYLRRAQHALPEGRRLRRVDQGTSRSAPGALCPHQPRGVDPQHQPDPAVADRLSQRQNPGLERPGFVNRTGSSGPASRDRVSPSRNGTVTASCGVCDAPLPTGRQRLWCSDACRQSAWRRRHNQCHTGRAVRCPVSTRATGL